MKDVIKHYDALIEEGVDFVKDPPQLQEYMNKWDGQTFIEELKLASHKSVLEIGVGSGRLAVKTAPLCHTFTGIDISPKTLERAKENLLYLKNVKLICDDFLCYRFCEKFDIIYSSLTFMHIKDKYLALHKAAMLLKQGGLFVLSIDKNDSKYINYGERRVLIYPDRNVTMVKQIGAASMKIQKTVEVENAFIFVCTI